MSILDKINNVDLELLKEQSHLIDSLITNLESEYNHAITDEVAERANYDIDLAKGLLELVDNIVIHLEESQ